VLVCFVGGTLFLFLIYFPSFAYRDAAASQYQVQTDLMEWMAANESYVRTDLPEADNTSASILSLVDSSAKASSIVLQRYEPIENGVRLTIDNVQFNALITWLGSLSQTANIKVKQISIDRKDTSGMVDARMDLER
jgi:general secretion pathway protein M